MNVHIELFTANICSRCVEAKSLMRSIVSELANEQVRLDCVDVVKNLDHAVESGVLATPALAINGKLVFCPLPGKDKIMHAIRGELQQ